jgi:hypothetical protein
MKTIIEQADEYAKRNKSDTRQAWIDGYNAALKKRSGKKELDLSFVPYEYIEIIKTWIKWKKTEKKFTYGQMGIETCFHRLYELSNGNQEIAARIVGQSIGNGWSGLFELKDGYIFNNNEREVRNSPNIFDVADSILQGNKQ